MPEPTPQKKKHSFDAEGKAAEILERLDKSSLKKGRFINLCIELAEQQAFDALIAEIHEAKKPSAPASEKSNRAGKKP